MVPASLLEGTYSFSGHETFVLRYAWLPKVVQSLAEEPKLFMHKDAFVRLGVGKNMAQSIRHWGHACGILETGDRAEPDRRTDLGNRLLTEGGWDPYLEDPGTLWLLHWNLVTQVTKASTWHLAFTRFQRETFTREELVEWLLELTETRANTAVTRNSLERDIAVFIRSYVPAQVRPTVPLEETFDSPLTELGLIREQERDTYTFVRGEKSMLPREIFIYALLDYWRRAAPEQSTLAFETLLHGPNSPGAAFKLTENALVALLVKLPEWTGVRFDETAGMRQLLRVGERLAPLEALERYYRPGAAR